MSKRISNITSTTFTSNTSLGLEGDGTQISAANKSVAVLGGAGVTIGQVTGGRVDVQLSDPGALAAAVRLSETNAELQRDTYLAALGVSQDAIDAGVGFGRAAFELVSDLTDGYAGIISKSLADSRQTLNDALSFASGAVDKTATASDARVQQIGVAALVAAVALAFILKSG